MAHLGMHDPDCRVAHQCGNFRDPCFADGNLGIWPRWTPSAWGDVRNSLVSRVPLFSIRLLRGINEESTL